MSHTSRPRGARLLVLVAASAALAGAGLCAAPLATAAPAVSHATPAATTAGGYVPLAPTRVVDTRNATGVPRGKVGPGGIITSSMVSRAGLPALGGATAVVLDLTSTSSTTGTYLTAYPGGASVPATSSLNVVGSWTATNLVTVPLSATGTVSIYNKAGSTDVIADVVGYYASAENASYGGLTPLVPKRALDSRIGGERFRFGDYVDISNDFSDSTTDINGDITGWVANVTAVDPTGYGYLTAWSGAGPKPATTALSFTPGVTSAGLVEVPRGSITVDGKTLPSFRLQTYIGTGSTGLIVDVVGVYTKAGTGADARFVPLTTPMRIVDTRGSQAPNLAPATTRTFASGGVGSAATVALAANLTIAGPTAPTYVSVAEPADQGMTGTSSVNANKGGVVANADLVPVSEGTTTAGSFAAYNSAGTTPFLVDVSGVFDIAATTATPSLQGLLRPQATRG